MDSSSSLAENSTSIKFFWDRVGVCRTSKSWGNPYRRFLHCPWYFENNPIQCKYFKWIDPNAPLDVVMNHRKNLWELAENKRKDMAKRFSELRGKLLDGSKLDLSIGGRDARQSGNDSEVCGEDRAMEFENC